MTEIDKDMLDDLVGCIGRLAAEMFSDPQIQKEFAEWKQKKKESQDVTETGLDRLNQPISFYQIKEINHSECCSYSHRPVFLGFIDFVCHRGKIMRLTITVIGLMQIVLLACGYATIVTLQAQIKGLHKLVKTQEKVIKEMARDLLLCQHGQDDLLTRLSEYAGNTEHKFTNLKNWTYSNIESQWKLLSQPMTGPAIPDREDRS